MRRSSCRPAVASRATRSTSTALAVSAAKAVGVSANYALEIEQAKVTATLRGGLEQALFQVQDPPAGADSQELSLMQMAGCSMPPALATDSLIHHVAAMQRKEGDWPNYGVARPPLEDGGFSHTAMGIRSLRLYPIAGRKQEFDERVSRAAAWLEKAQPLTTEDRTMQILGIVWAGRKAPADRVKQLLALQRSDGGWGQTVNLPSDAYGTGEALWTLHEAGLAATDSAYRRGVDYLLAHAKGRRLLARGHARVRLPALFRKRLPARARPVDFPIGHGDGGDCFILFGKVGYSPKGCAIRARESARNQHRLSTGPHHARWPVPPGAHRK